MKLSLEITLTLHTPGLDAAIRAGARDIAAAIDRLAGAPPQITTGSLRLDPQSRPTGGALMATPIINSQPQHVTAIWTGIDSTGAVVPVVPDRVDFSSSDPTGVITPDPANPTGGFTYTATPGLLGDVTFNAVSHQNGLADFTASPVTGTLVSAPSAAVQITGGALSLDPQAPGGRKK